VRFDLARWSIIATGWTECVPLVRRDGALVVEAIKYLQGQFPSLLIGVDFDNDSAFMSDVVIPWCREQKFEVTRSRAYKKNNQTFVEQRGGQFCKPIDTINRLNCGSISTSI
jgi:hypothetical protein